VVSPISKASPQRLPETLPLAGEMMRQYVVVHAAVIVVLERAARRERKESDGGTGQATDHRCAHASV
jgi:hypothetical protein